MNQLFARGGGAGFLGFCAAGLAVIILNPPFFCGRTARDQRRETRRKGMALFMTVVFFNIINTNFFLFFKKPHLYNCCRDSDPGMSYMHMRLFYFHGLIG